MQSILAVVSVCRLPLSLYSEANCILLLCVFAFEMQCDSGKETFLYTSFFFSCFFFFPSIHKSVQLRLTVKLCTVSSLDILGLSFSISAKAAWSLSDLGEGLTMTTEHGLWFGLCLFVLFDSVWFFVCELWLLSNKVGLLESWDLEFPHYIFNQLRCVKWWQYLPLMVYNFESKGECVCMGHLHNLLCICVYYDLCRISKIQNESIYTSKWFPSQNPAGYQSTRRTGFFSLFSHICFTLSKAEWHAILPEQHRNEAKPNCSHFPASS